jgi:tetratricopeptide (TPR) repeat protein
LIGLGLAHFETSSDRLRYEAEIRQPFEEISEGGPVIPASILQLIASLETQRIRYSEMARQALLDTWRQPAEQEGFLAANRLVLEAFQRRLSQVMPDMRQYLEAEVAYHLLIVDEASGVDYLNDRFEQACERYHLDIARALVDYLGELRLYLRQAGREWHRYFEARQSLLGQVKDVSQASFQALAEEASDEFLRALALWQLGEYFLSKQDWTASIRSTQKSLGMFLRLNRINYAGRAMLTLGDAYLDLSERSGGRQRGPDPEDPQVSRLLLIIQNLPFLAYHWLAGRISILPGGQFLGTNYQNWIISYLLSKASGWYRQAERRFAGLGDSVGLVEARLDLAEVELMRQSTRRAEIAYAGLKQQNEVNNSPHRTARVLQGLGSAALDRKEYAVAVQRLEKAVSIFRYLQDLRLQAEGSLLLGRAYAAQGQFGAAVAAYSQSMAALVQAGDHLAYTQLIWEIEALAGRPDLSEGDRREWAELLARTAEAPERSYLTPFPESLLRLFRRIAVIISLPVTMLLTLVLSLLLANMLSVLEGLFHLKTVDPSGSLWNLGNMVVLITSTILPIPVAIWTFQLVYSLAGFLMARVLGWLVAPVAKEGPEIVRVSPQGLSVQRQEEGKIRRMAWSQVRLAVSADICLVRKPIQLISRQYFTGEGERLEVKGTTRGYVHLKKEIASHIGEHTQARDLDFVVLKPLWTVAAALFSIAFSIYVWVVLEKLKIYGGPAANPTAMIELLFSTIVFMSVLNLFFFWPPVILWRAAWQINRVRRLISSQPHAIPSWSIWLAAIFSSLLVIGWLLLWQFGEFG